VAVRLREEAAMLDIGRREFMALLGGATAAWPLAARAQQAGKLPTIGFLVAGTPSSHGQWVAAFVQRLRELGWIEGRTIAIEYRWFSGWSFPEMEVDCWWFITR
jgi:putative ABC transport system substrate-binding protein